MPLFLTEYAYETAIEKGRGRIVLVARHPDEAIAKAKMIGGADSRLTDVTAQELAGGFFRLSSTVDESHQEVKAREEIDRARHVAPRFAFEVAAKAVVVATDQWQAYRKLAGLVKMETPPPGLKRKVLGKEPVDDVTRAEANAQYAVTRIFAGGKAGG